MKYEFFRTFSGLGVAAAALVLSTSGGCVHQSERFSRATPQRIQRAQMGARAQLDQLERSDGAQPNWTRDHQKVFELNVSQLPEADAFRMNLRFSNLVNAGKVRFAPDPLPPPAPACTCSCTGPSTAKAGEPAEPVSNRGIARAPQGNTAAMDGRAIPAASRLVPDGKMMPRPMRLMGPPPAVPVPLAPGAAPKTP